MERLSGLDASFLYLETPSLHMHVALAMVFDPKTVPGGYSFDSIKAAIGHRIPEAPVFRRRLVEVPLALDHPVWIDDPDFDIDYHIRLTAVPRPGGLHQLADLAGDIAGHQLDRSRPLWELWFVEGLDAEQIGLVAKMHHSTVDGVSGAALLSVLFDLEPDPAATTGPGPTPDTDPAPGRSSPSPGTTPTAEPIPSSIELVTQALFSRAMRQVDLTREVLRTGRRLLDVRKVRLSGPPRSNRTKAALPLSAPRTSFNAAVTRRRSVAMCSTPLNDVKRLKNHTGTTVNDVILAVCTGALRSFLDRQNELPDKPLVAVVPVSVHTDVATRSSNRVSSMFVQLPVDLADPIERLEAIHEGTKGAKEEHNALGADMLLNWAEHATPTVFANAARLYSRMRLADRHRPIANLVISNVPGPDSPLYLCGAELTAGFPLGPVMDGMGLNITIMSYRGTLHWGLMACPESIPQLWRLVADIPLAVDELLYHTGLATAVDRRAEDEDAVPRSDFDVPNR